MSQVEIKVRNVSFRVESDDQSRLMDLANKYSARLDELAHVNGTASDLRLCILAGLFMEDSIDALNQNAQKASNNNVQDVEKLKVSYNEAISQIADYIDNLASSIEKS